MRTGAASRLFWTGASLLVCTAAFVILHHGSEFGAAHPLLHGFELAFAALTFGCFLPALTARIYLHHGDPGLTPGIRLFASGVEAALYGLMLLLPVSLYLTAPFEGVVGFLGFIPPSSVQLGAADMLVAITQGLADAALILFILQIRSRGLAVLAATARSLHRQARSKDRLRTR